MTDYFAATALLPTGPARDVRITVDGATITDVRTDARPDGATVLPGTVLPGFANAHSHAFHRALRGRTHDAGGSFWTWRERMYAVAARLDPDSYYRLARAVYAEMVLAGFTSVGEFHYLRTAADGRPYDDPNAMAAALAAAAADAGIRLTLLDACYLTAGVDGAALAGPQRRFGDRDADQWSIRFHGLQSLVSSSVHVGAAIHSVRAVPIAALPVVVAAADERPLHVHLSEQPAENAACVAAYGRTPTRVLHDAGVLGPRTTAVHATHLTGDDIALLGSARTRVCLCPTTERDLADGLGPSRRLRDAGCALSLGSDQHAVIDAFEEARGLESHERLASGERGRFTQPDLLAALTDHAGIGWDAPGELCAGGAADLVVVDPDSPRTAGAATEQLLMAATAADVRTVIVAGTPVVQHGVHRLGDVGRLLHDAITPLWRDA